MFIYLVTNKVNGKLYVGQHSGKNLERYWDHCIVHALNGNHGKDRLLYRAIRKHGRDNFVIEPLVIVSSKWEMDLYEIGLIAAWGLRNPEIGYNLAAGGKGTVGFKFSEESIKRLSDSHKGIKPSDATLLKRSIALTGQKRSEETKKKMSEALKGNQNCLGHKHSPETCKRLSEVNKGNKNAVGAIRTPEYCRQKSESQIGRKFSDETRAKMSKSATGKIVTEETRKRMSAARKGNPVIAELLRKHQTFACRKGVHVRLHVNKGVVKEGCEFCKEQLDGIPSNSSRQHGSGS